MTYVAAGALLLGVIAYALFGGADFGAGFWELTSGRSELGSRASAQVETSLAPVWEANNVWLIYCLVVFWTAFPGPFSAVMTTLYIPLGLAALGLVLRGSAFAFRKILARPRTQRLTVMLFALSSVLTPFFFGATVGGIAGGRVPARGHGPALSSWVNPMSLLSGVFAVAVCAYLAAVFLTVDAGQSGDAELQAWFRRRGWAAAWVSGALAVVGLLVARSAAPRLFDRLLGQALPVVAVSVLTGLAALLLLRRGSPRLVRLLAATAVAGTIGGWGAAQYPYLLATSASVTEAAAPHASLVTLVIVLVVAAVLIGPSFVLLYRLQQRAQLEG